MRIAVAGVGLRSGHVLSLLTARMPEATIVGYYDPNPTFLSMLGEQLPRYPSIETLVSDANADLLFVGSPNIYHLEQIVAGIQGGLKVFTEKPVVTSLEDSWALASLLQKYGSHNVMVGLVLRYSQHMLDLNQCISQGYLGDIASMEASEHIAPYHGAFFMRDWRRSTALSGGFMLEKCCHDIDIYNMLANSRPSRVASFGARRSFLPEYSPQHSSQTDTNTNQYHQKASHWKSTDDPFNSDGDIIDCQNAIIEYESGASLSFHTNINVPDEHRRFCVIGSEAMAEGDFVRGYLRVTSARNGKQLFNADYSQTDKQSSAHYGADEMMVDDLIKYFRQQSDALPVSIVDAIEAGIGALAIDEARVSGSMVNLQPYWQKLDSFKLRQ